MNRKIYILLTVLLAWSFGIKAQTAVIESTTATPGASVTFDIDVAGLPANVGAVSLFIGYDPNVLTFTGSTGNQLTGYILNNMIGTNQIGIQWTNPSGEDINGTLLTLNFQYSSLGGSCDLTFNPGCEFTDILLNPVAVSYTNGGIGPIAGVATITIDEILATAGPVSLGVTGASFAGDVGAITLFIEFDPTVLTFTGFTSTLPSMLVTGNNTSGLISVAWSSTAGASINNTFLNLSFNYTATGSSELVFTGACEVTYPNLDPAVVSFDNGLVEPLATAYNLTIADVVATPGSAVSFSITAAGYPTNVGAMTLYIGYDPAHLDFLNITSGTITGAFANVINPGLLGITWSSATGQAINGIILSLNFDYNFGSSDVTFEGGCEITDNTLASIPTTYHDGSINPVSGGPQVRMPIKTGTVGQPIDFPVRALNFSMDIAAISLFIGFEDDVLTYTGHTPGTISGYFINYMSATSQIGVQWSEYPAIDIDPNNDDTLFTIHFLYNGGESELTFDAGCEFAKEDLSTAPVSFFDGAVITGTRFNIKAFLEGPFNGTTMNTILNSSGYLPLSQPYNVAPWNYSGTESVAVIPNGSVVDWVILEIRETAGAAATATSATTVARQAAFILNDGTIVSVDGSSEVLIPATFTDNVYVVIYHRNHLAMMSSVPVTLVSDVFTYDFTTAQGQAYNIGQKILAGGVGMYAADGDGNGDINLSDFTDIWVPQFGFLGYNKGDFDLNGDVNLSDFTDFWVPNFGKLTQVP